MPKISVIMPAYNAEKYIDEAIESILGQTFKDFEFIILNDCSKDRTEEIILSYGDPRIIYLKNEQNLGVAATLNKGLAIAQGEYIARMDADDISLPERFEKQVRYLDAHSDIAVLGSSIERFSDNSNLGIRSFSSDPELMAIDMLFACGLAHPSVMMRTDVIRSLGGYDLAFNGLEDYELWCRVLENHKITTLPDVLLRYRIHSSQVTQNPSSQYIERMNRLKNRQLRSFGVPEQTAECYLAYCNGSPPKSEGEITQWCAFLSAVLDANQSHHIYSEKKLVCYFRNIATSSASRLPVRSALNLGNKYSVVSKSGILLHKLRNI